MGVSNRNISIDISLRQMVDTNNTNQALMLTDKEKKLLSEETSKWLATLKSKKTEGKLHEDEKVVNDGNYEGDLNEENDACGWGVCKTLMGHTYQGTMMNDKYHGYGIITLKNGQKIHGEMK